MKVRDSKILILFLCAFIILSVTISGIYIISKNNIQFVYTDEVVDTGNLNELTGLADYVFVGLVEEYETGRYANGDLYTEYMVDILINIKGILPGERALPIIKDGFPISEKNAFLIEEGDYYPETGDICIFYVSVQEDGSLLIAGENCNNKIDHISSLSNINKNQITEDIKKSENYIRAVDAYENEAEYSRGRFTIDNKAVIYYIANIKLRSVITDG